MSTAQVIFMNKTQGPGFHTSTQGEQPRPLTVPGSNVIGVALFTGPFLISFYMHCKQADTRAFFIDCSWYLQRKYSLADTFRSVHTVRPRHQYLPHLPDSASSAADVKPRGLHLTSTKFNILHVAMSRCPPVATERGSRVDAYSLAKKESGTRNVAAQWLRSSPEKTAVQELMRNVFEKKVKEPQTLVPGCRELKVLLDVHLFYSFNWFRVFHEMLINLAKYCSPLSIFGMFRP